MLKEMQVSESISCFHPDQMSDYHDQFSRMDIAMPLPVSSSLLYGPEGGISDLLALSESEISSYGDSNSFGHHGQLDALPAMYSEFLMEYQSGPISPMASERLYYPAYGTSHLNMVPCDDNAFLQPVSLGKRLSAQQSGYGMQNAKRLAVQITDSSLERNPILLGKQSAPEEATRNKKIAACFHDRQDHHKVQELNKADQRVPIRRSQKVADRITALQKIVSPYGKTDTASVLHEASVFIKVLLEQIQKLTPEQNIRQKDVDLRAKGLCVIPVSLMEKLMKEEESYYQPSASMNSFRA